MQINLGSVQLPINSATKTFAILAKRGAGKSYTGAVMAEEFFENNIPFVIFDPIDVWWGLRLNKNGKDKGLPVVVFGLEHADIELTRDMGRRIAQAVVKENISCVISTFGMPKVGQRHLIAEFSEEILNINNSPRHIFIEEAHEFVPQRVFGAAGRTFNAVSNLVVMGRNRGLGVTLINQRAATVNKDVLTQIDTLLAFRNVAPQDRKALREWVEAHGHESHLMQKDIEIRQKDAEIRRLASKLAKIAEMAGAEATEGVSASGCSPNVDMWCEKLGNTGATRILKFLAESAPMTFTRSQVALSVKMSGKGGSFVTYVATLKRNNLIIERDGKICINPDL